MTDPTQSTCPLLGVSTVGPKNNLQSLTSKGAEERVLLWKGLGGCIGGHVESGGRRDDRRSMRRSRGADHSHNRTELVASLLGRGRVDWTQVSTGGGEEWKHLTYLKERDNSLVDLNL